MSNPSEPDNPLDAFDVPTRDFAADPPNADHESGSSGASLELVVIGGPQHVGERFDLPERQSRLLGRRHTSDIVLEGEEVSRRHCRLRVEGGRCHVTDLGSQNLIRVRGRKVTECTIDRGETFRIGEYHLQIVSPGAPAVEEPETILTPETAPEQVDVGFTWPLDEPETILPPETASEQPVSLPTVAPSRPRTGAFCPFCQAPVVPGAVVCDACEREIPRKPGVGSLTGADATTQEVSDGEIRLNLIAATALAVAVCAAAMLGVSLAALTAGAVAALIVGAIARRDIATQLPVTSGRRVALAAIMVALVTLTAAYGQRIYKWHTADTGLVYCKAQLRGVFKALQRYADINDSRLPPNLQEMADIGLLNKNVLACPAARDTRRAAYRYVAGQSFKDHPANVLVYEEVGNHPGSGAHVVYVDGTVRWVGKDEFVRQIQATEKRLRNRSIRR